MADFSFKTWLGEKLKSLQLDEEVYYDYVKGVLEEEEIEAVEARESLSEILSGILDTNVEEVVSDILNKWSSSHKETVCNDSTAVFKINGTTDDKIKTIMEKQQNQVVGRGRTNVDTELKRMVLEQYAAASNEEENDSDDKEADEPSSEFVNTNVKSVINEQQAKREQAKKENEERKQRDKLNREKDKQKVKERQEKEKKRTQKGERRAR